MIKKHMLRTHIRFIILMLGLMIGLGLNFCKYHHILPPSLHEIQEMVMLEYRLR